MAMESADTPQRPRLKRVLTWTGKSVGVVWAAVLALYAARVRSVVNVVGENLGHWLLYIGLVVVGAVAGWEIRSRAQSSRRSEVHPRGASPHRGALELPLKFTDEDIPSDEVVAGRHVRYLERATESDTLVVMLHGMGLDADDFDPYMRVASAHAVALTSFGFAVEEADDSRYRPISLRTHALILSYAINHFHDQHKDKRLVLVGFSIGADMIMRLVELWKERSEPIDLYGVLLLDPDVGYETLPITQQLAVMDVSNPTPELNKIMQRPQDLEQFIHFTEYLRKICRKNLAQVRRHANDWLDYWREEPNARRFSLFLDRIKSVYDASPRVRVVLTDFTYDLQTEIGNLAKSTQYRSSSKAFAFKSGVGHFDTIGAEFLETEIHELLTPSSTAEGLGQVTRARPR